MRRNPKAQSLLQAMLTTTILMVVVSLMVLLFTSCQHKPLDYDGDGALVRFRYTTPANDVYSRSISSLRWLLYNSAGVLVEDMLLTEGQWLYHTVTEIPDGDYTVVVLSNATAFTTQDQPDNLGDYLLTANTLSDDHTYYHNTDHLFWTMQHFKVVRGQVTDVACPLADIHCHLHVHVKWKTLPRQSGQWSLRMYGVPVEYVGGDIGNRLNGISYPLFTGQTGEHRVNARMYNFELDGEFVTFRWTETAIPQLQLWCDNEPVSAQMDLRKAFDEWKWHPEQSLSQDYYLELTILDDGSADLAMGGRASVVDWQDGGTIGN